jgi:glyoxylase-like metal-dependent hydrolase (beta-lactamase superfamily II)
MSAAPKLPPQLHVFVRDWLSSNNVLLKSRDGHVLIDSGYVRHAPLTMALLATPAGVGSDPLAKLVNTHCHSDHIGGNATIKAHYRCPIALPAAEAPLIDRWDEMALLLGYCDQRTDRFAYDEIIRPGETQVWGGLEWRALAAPGHDMAALVFHNPEHGILISGDALWQNGFGVVFPELAGEPGFHDVRATLDLIAALGARVVIPGHGGAFEDVDAALERAYSRLDYLAADPLRNAENAVRVLLKFLLLERRRMPLTEVESLCATVPLLVLARERFFGGSSADLADRLVRSLVKAGAARIDGATLVDA